MVATTRGAGSDQMKIARNGQGKGIMEIDQRPVRGHQLANPVVFLSVGSGILTKNGRLVPRPKKFLLSNQQFDQISEDFSDTN